MKSIIEKLGITQGPWKAAFDLIYCGKPKKQRYLFKAEDDCSLADFRIAKAAPEMLEVLIESSTFTYRAVDWYGPDPKVDKWKAVIEQATGKTWEDVKRLLEEE